MAHPYHHATSSTRQWGGSTDDFLPIHNWFDESKKIIADLRHRALRHHAEGIFMAETIFGPTVTLSTGRMIPVRWVGDQHVREDLGFIPSFADWVKAIRPERWMGSAPQARIRTFNPSTDGVTAMTIPTNTILNADCLNALPALPESSIDFILTDPPYLVRYKSRDGRSVPNDDNDAWLKPAFAEMYRVLKHDAFAVSFYGWPAADKFLAAYRGAGFRPVGHLTFPKGYSSSAGFVRSEHENAHLLVKGNPWRRDGTIADVLPWRYTGNRLHPAQKPLEALEPLIAQFCPPDGIVLDPFAGSGSTLEAAQRLARRWIGIELSPEYHAIANRRLNKRPDTADGSAMVHRLHHEAAAPRAFQGHGERLWQNVQ